MKWFALYLTMAVFTFGFSAPGLQDKIDRAVAEAADGVEQVKRG